MEAMAAETAAANGEAFYMAAEFWVMVAFFITVVLIAKPAFRTITAALDSRAEGIRERIDEAERLRDEAQDLLASYQRKQRDAAREAEQIVDRAREETERLAERAAESLEKSLKRRETMALERIAQAEAKAVDEVRIMAVDVALEAARRLLAEKMSDKKSDAMIDQAVEELPDKLH